jgi:hypothetical protein
MRTIRKLIFAAGGMLGIGLLASCLKENPATVDFTTVKPVIEQLNSANFSFGGANGGSLVADQNSYFMQLRVDSTGTATDSVVLNIAGQLINKDVTVTIAVDSAAFNTFNTNNGGGFVLLPASAYTITNNTATIKAGQRSANAFFQFNTGQIDFTQPYLLPISITDAQGTGISGNYGTTLYAIVPGNQYMGLYQSVGQRTMGTNTYSINDLKYLFDLSGITTFQGYYPTARVAPTSFIPNAVVANCADQTVYLSIGEQMDLTVNPDNSVTVSNDNIYYFGTYPFPYTLISGSSSYDPGNHVFKLSYGFIDPVSGDSSVVSETITRVR